MAELALITGASWGIGLELARIFAREGYDVVLVARSKDRLNKIARKLKEKYNVEAHVIDYDLSRDGSAREVFEQVERLGLTVDALVNNAGFGSCGAFADIDPDTSEQMVTLNVTTLTMLTRLFMAGMIERRHGEILNVASVAGFLPGPLMAVYYATKAYVISFTEALSVELEGTGVVISALCPGPVPTKFQETAKMKMSARMGPMIVSAQRVAQKGYDGLKRGDVLIVPGWANKMIVKVPRFLPRVLVPRLVYRETSKRVKE